MPNPNINPNPRPKPPPRPSVNCDKIRAECAKLEAQGLPEVAQFLLAVTGCAINVPPGT